MHEASIPSVQFSPVAVKLPKDRTCINRFVRLPFAAGEQATSSKGNNNKRRPSDAPGPSNISGGKSRARGKRNDSCYLSPFS